MRDDTAMTSFLEKDAKETEKNGRKWWENEITRRRWDEIRNSNKYDETSVLQLVAGIPDFPD